MLELLAALHSAERGPPTPITQFVDASYVIDTLELVTRGISSLRWARLKNAAIWRRLVKATFDRQERGIPISFVKCAAHGRAPPRAPPPPRVTRERFHSASLSGFTSVWVATDNL